MSFRYLVVCLLLVVIPFSRSMAADDLPAWASVGPDGGSVEALAVSPRLPNTVLAGLSQGYGIFKSGNRGASWGAATDGASRSVLDLAIDAKGKAFYAATHEGLLKSTNGGTRWRVLDEGRLGTYMLVAPHPSKAALLLIVQGGALFRSTDGGVTREEIDGPLGITKIVYAPAGRRTIVYAAAFDGIWKSGDDGLTWTAVNFPFASPPQVETIAVDPRDPRILYAGLRFKQRALFKSLDGGATWKPSQRGLPSPSPGGSLTVSELAVDPAKPSIVYAVVNGQLYRSINSGHDWSRPVPQLPGGGVINDLEVTSYGVLAGTSAGVLLSADRGLTWQIRVNGMAATTITGMAIDQHSPARLYAATTLAGIFKTANQGRPWLRLGHVAPPPGANQPLAVDPVDPDIVYTTAEAAVARSEDGGRHWALKSTFQCVDVSQIALDPREPGHVFASGSTSCPFPDVCTLFFSQDEGESWSCQGTAADQIAFLGIDPFTSAVYAQIRFTDLVRSTDDGATWTLLYSGLSALSFAPSPLVEGTLWAGQGHGVARSRDGGQTWQAFSAGLPSSESVVGLAADPVDPETLYAATQRSGVFKSTDAGETWSLAGRWPRGAFYQAGLLVDRENPEILYAGSSGLGVLRLDQGGD